ncbi:hypothetical protein ABIF99_010109 [Bradyrhizobium japonicum]|nr:hypothetical protein [Bradyrhizobium japonicum]MCP1855983.1 hypothetical protein [Bradyrhizobium japonicum]MCP1897202.1 hypothetical protein [Bradyrhizobium japonicum]MCW2330750.1 hypothetical protein [Bradyrhizobium japonicum]
MKSRSPGQRVHDDEPVYCAETGALISNDSPPNVVPFPRESRKRPLRGSESLHRPSAVDPGDDI